MVIPYLSFQGNCEEAFMRYAQVFGGKIVYLSRFSTETGSPALVGKVMHAQVDIGDGCIAGSDHETPPDHGQSVRLMVHCKTAQEAQTCIDGLSEGGGAVLSGLTPHPPPDDEGMGALVRDPYGYTWILTAPNDQRAE